MRFTVFLCSLLALSMIFVPIISINGENTLPANAKILPKNEQSTDVKSDELLSKEYKVLITSTGKVEKMSLEEYVIGAVCGEASPLWEDEAIKAQAVACRTFALYQKNKHLKNPDKALKGAYLSDDYNVYQSYISKKDAEKKWGSNFEPFYKKITSLTGEVSSVVMEYDNEIIMPAYFALCSGYTEDCKNVWGGDVPYLKSVTSPGDRLADDLIVKKTFSSEEFYEIMKKSFGKTISGPVKDCIKNVETTKIGTVKNVTVENETYEGSKIQSAFNLRSNNFTVKYNGENFIFTVTGNGHCVGMSQYGADYMARQGTTYEEILKHYYTGITLTTLH